MPRSRRIVLLLITLASLAYAVSLGAVAEPAMADRCQPEELVLGPGNSPLGHDDTDPRCPIMQAALYDQVSCDQTTFVKCVNSLSAAGTATMQRDRIRSICVVRQSEDYCYRSVGWFIDQYATPGSEPGPGGALPRGIREICVYGQYVYGCKRTLGDVVNDLVPVP